MENRLAVAADERDASWRDTKFTTSGNGGIGEKFSQTKIQLTESARSDGMLFGDAKNFLSYRGRELHGGVREQLRIQIWRRSGNAGEGNFNAVGRRARHHTEGEAGCAFHWLCGSNLAFVWEDRRKQRALSSQ